MPIAIDRLGLAAKVENDKDTNVSERAHVGEDIASRTIERFQTAIILCRGQGTCYSA